MAHPGRRDVTGGRGQDNMGQVGRPGRHRVHAPGRDDPVRGAETGLGNQIQKYRSHLFGAAEIGMATGPARE